MEYLFAQIGQQRPIPGGAGQGPPGYVPVIFVVLELVIVLVFAIPTIVGMWGVFTKAGEPGWAAIIPIFNMVTLLKIIDKPIWWILILMCCPVVNLVIQILMALELAKRFGKEAGFAIGLFLLPFVFYPILGFGSARYIPPGLEHEDDDHPRQRRRDWDLEDDEDR